MRQFEALYYPYASIGDTAFLKSALLYFDKLWLIGSYYSIEDTAGEFRELLEDRTLVECIHGDDLAFPNRDILSDAISTDMADQAFLNLTHRPEHPWEIYEDKGLYAVESLLRPLESNGRRIVLPYEQGESFLLNMVLLAAAENPQRLVPLTDREKHHAVLHHKLRRGAEGQLQRLYGDKLDMAHAESLVSIVGRDLVRTELPTPEELQKIPLEKLKDFRDKYREDRDKLRDKLFLMIDEALGEEDTALPARLHMRIEALIHERVRHLEHDRAWSTRIIKGLRTVTGAIETVAKQFSSSLTGVPVQFGLAAGGAAASSHVLDFIKEQVSQLRLSDVTYLYRVREEFGS
jgi:hypothetical protein